MQPLSESARLVLDRMEPDRRYDAQEIRAFCPDTGVERLREIMHELWVHRHVERVGYLAWRRHRSAPGDTADAESVDARRVRPEDLFDHAAFAEFFE